MKFKQKLGIFYNGNLFICQKNEIYYLVIIDEVALVSKFYGMNVCFFYLL